MSPSQHTDRHTVPSRDGKSSRKTQEKTAPSQQELQYDRFLGQDRRFPTSSRESLRVPCLPKASISRYRPKSGLEKSMRSNCVRQPPTAVRTQPALSSSIPAVAAVALASSSMTITNPSQRLGQHALLSRRFVERQSYANRKQHTAKCRHQRGPEARHKWRTVKRCTTAVFALELHELVCAVTAAIEAV